MCIWYFYAFKKPTICIRLGINFRKTSNYSEAIEGAWFWGAFHSNPLPKNPQRRNMHDWHRLRRFGNLSVEATWRITNTPTKRHIYVRNTLAFVMLHFSTIVVLWRQARHSMADIMTIPNTIKFFKNISSFINTDRYVQPTRLSYQIQSSEQPC